MSAAPDYFALLELPRDYTLDEDALHRAYVQKQREFHPDTIGRSSQEERARAMQMSVEINQAYHTLRNPLRRAEYMLSLHGVRVGDDKAAVKPSQEILLESMETREAVMEAETPDALEALKDKHQREFADCVEQFAAEYPQEVMDAAAQTAIRMRYLEKLLEEIRARAVMLMGDKAAS